MKNEKDCKIIADLLPNYIENLTNETTNQYIEEHLKECQDCKNALENMKKDLNINEADNCKEANFLKKYSRRHRTLKLILLIIILIFLGLIARKFIIMFFLDYRASQNNTDIPNRYYKEVTYTDNTLGAREVFYNDGTILVRAKGYNFEGGNVFTTTVYKSDKESFALIDEPNSKIIIYDDVGNVDASYTSVSPYTTDKLSFFLLSTFQRVTLDGKECYLVKYKNIEQFIDIETGLIIKYINNDDNTVTDYYYEFGTVTDSDIEKPDISGYVEVKPEELE